MTLAAVGVATTGAVGAAETDDVELRVLSLNIFYGGDELNLRSFNWCRRVGGCPETFAKLVEAIHVSGADIVAIQEAAMSTRRLAEALQQTYGQSWYFDEQMHVISRHPLVDPPGAEHYYTLVEVAHGKVVAIANTHLLAEPYGPYELRDGVDPAEVMTIEESTRLPQIAAYLAALDERLEPHIPLFFAGDFNTPSHLDWTADAADARGDFFLEFAWPVSVALEEAGFVDSYRAAHPDPVSKPGFTWSTGGPESVRDEVHDRIDWVLVRGPEHSFQVISSEILGEQGGPDVDIAFDCLPLRSIGRVDVPLDARPGDARGVRSLVGVQSRGRQ
jgi:exonuclease III